MVVSSERKKYITQKMSEFAAYDAMRPDGHPYEFHTHAERVAQSAKAFAKRRGYDDEACEAIYWATLPHDIGKMAFPVAIWDLKDKPTDEQRTERREHVTRGVEIIRKDLGDEACDNDPFMKMLIDIMLHHHETFDQKGPLGIDASQLSEEVRMVCICDAFDGWSVKRPHFEGRDLTPTAVIERMEIEKVGQFDPALLKQFKDMKLCQSKPYSSPQSPSS